MMHIANISAYHRFLRLLRTAGGRLFFVVAAAAFALAAQPQTANAKPMIMKLGTATVNDVQVEAIKRFAKRVEKRTNGKIKGKIFPGAQLGSNARMIEGLQLGTLEVYVGPPAYLVGVDPRFQILDVPGIFTDMQHAWRTIQDEEFRKVFLALGMKKGLVGVSLFIYSPTSFATKVPIRTLADFKGKKLRVMASEMERAATNALGATAVPIDFSQVVPALQRGTVDGMKSGLSAFTTIKVYDVVKYATLTHEAIIPEVMMVSKVWFDKLPKATQQILIEEGKAVQPELLKFTLKAQMDARKIWKQHGGELIELSAGDRAAMMKMLSNVAEKVFSGKPQLRGIYNLLVKTAAKNR